MFTNSLDNGLKNCIVPHRLDTSIMLALKLCKPNFAVLNLRLLFVCANTFREIIRARVSRESRGPKRRDIFF